MKARRLLITGAAGFTGRHAAAYFQAAGAEVTAVVRHTAAASVFPAQVKQYVCDLSDRRAVRSMIEEIQPDEVLHLAGKNSVPESWRDPLLYMETNVMSTLYLLEALRTRPARRILVAGSRLKYRPGLAEGPPHPYSLSKTLAELASLAWCTLFKQPVLLAEPCNLIGPGPSTGFCSLLAQHIVRSEAAAGTSDTPPPFKLSSRYDRRDFLDVRDAVKAYDCILRKGETGKIYRIDSGIQRGLGEIAEQLLAHAAVPVGMEWGPDNGEAEQASALAAAAVPETLPATSANKESSVSPEDNAASLGWSPQVKLARSLADIVDYYRASREGGA
ncbi:NAD-dependent epimerase/dehydratase family protein [Paenibacillus sp. S150]|uniref:NAD-dependent epimerase/dehydratase family protein n=1 Tax=Paenibacillus sp. S150 TaxID=2749826 RepID=UPI001C597D83|nr:NAD-dependent epimerase/dehydratase family protein [Paenibacillus sp. S150]MBW4081067.1 NAD-dependent epimerase/dehydratase family protein [Paenibacillus sp. S150]